MEILTSKDKQVSAFAVVITSISGPNPVMRSIASSCENKEKQFIVIGDTKSPDDFELKDCDYYSMDRQLELPYSLAGICPTRHYARKNIGYLRAIEQGFDVIVETDDDNFPLDAFWEPRSANQQAEILADSEGWFNVYSLFSKENIWPRGLPLERLQDSHEGLTKTEKEVYVPIQQGLADQNPDVDAVYRMTLPLPLDFDKRGPVALDEGLWCPFNSQNTTWFKPAFPLLYLPAYCSFRMTDIWRSFVAQRLAWTCDWKVLFHQSTVYQERNEHNLLKDFEDEIPGYLNNTKIANALMELDLKNGVEHLGENLMRCYKMMVAQNWIVDEKELTLVEAWLNDLDKIS